MRFDFAMLTTTVLSKKPRKMTSEVIPVFAFTETSDELIAPALSVLYQAGIWTIENIPLRTFHARCRIYIVDVHKVEVGKNNVCALTPDFQAQKIIGQAH